MGTFTADELIVLKLKEQYHIGSISYDDEGDYSKLIEEMEEEIRYKTYCIGTEEPHIIRYFYVTHSLVTVLIWLSFQRSVTMANAICSVIQQGFLNCTVI